MTWPAVFALAVGTWMLKAVGPVLAGGRRLPTRVDSVVALLPPALLAALVAVQTFAEGQALAVDARLAGMAVAGVAALARAPFLVVVTLAAATAAGVRLL